MLGLVSTFPDYALRGLIRTETHVSVDLGSMLLILVLHVEIVSKEACASSFRGCPSVEGFDEEEQGKEILQHRLVPLWCTGCISFRPGFGAAAP